MQGGYETPQKSAQKCDNLKYMDSPSYSPINTIQKFTESLEDVSKDIDELKQNEPSLSKLNSSQTSLATISVTNIDTNDPEILELEWL